MLTLLTYPAAFGLFSGSPFCVKAAYMLELSGQSWQRSDMLDPRKMPHRKLPVLRTRERLMPDSDTIRHWLESQGANFDQGLSDIQKGQSRALIRMAEDHLYFQMVADRWCNDQVWPHLRDTFFHEIPRFARGFVSGSIRKSVIKGLDMQGVTRFSEAERLDRVEQDLTAITAFLWQSPFLMGERPTSADLSVAPILAAIRATPVRTELRGRIERDQVLSDYIDRVDQAIVLK
ncbi:glutathione S-transferase family protein [Phaeobacter gallaeciensis]|uniref:Glutathione S-transferase family protein n=2 Tax=Roseobacteraceae TaxID=2854170 RepID=A0A366X897_9RHOB|nr:MULTISPECIES: glutathione S-transferase family protein [Roseobacteraceae]MBT3141960.1 glutathione S-transferase family protein [Falsiruegeria litorea]MBT8168693.1 glutathione S-transferase family protein [Falsiruegeria litorea]RBW60041.1 glutathione S-transferase family protein [Phaeobacter gallaeciensis]